MPTAFARSDRRLRVGADVDRVVERDEVEADGRGEAREGADREQKAEQPLLDGFRP
jgi:hypothetical protein